MPTLPVDHVARTCSLPSAVVKPRARPFSQSITALGASDSFGAPTVGQPCDRPVPADDECTTEKPRGTQSLTSEFEIPGRLRACTGGWLMRGGGWAPTSCRTFHSDVRGPDVPAKYGLDS